jgi:lysophospholipase L1-like esterase
VFAIGDSLGQGTRPYLPRALPGWKVSQSVSISRFVTEGVSIVRSRGGLPGAIVFALGTNDDAHNVTTFRNSVDAVVGIAGKTRCVVVPNIVRPPVGGASYSGFNQALAELAKRHDNLRVVDWAGLVSRNRGWLAGDGVHVNATGYAARAAAIAKQVEKC